MKNRSETPGFPPLPADRSPAGYGSARGAPPPPPAPDAAAPPARDPVDGVVLALVAGINAEAAARKFGVPEGRVAEVVKAARRKLTVVAEFNRDEELGLTIKRLDECYRKAFGSDDPDMRLCVSILRDKSKLLDLYGQPGGGEGGGAGDGAARAELAEVRAHLAPLQLGDDDTPTPELARRAVSRLVNLSSAQPSA